MSECLPLLRAHQVADEGVGVVAGQIDEGGIAAGTHEAVPAVGLVARGGVALHRHRSCVIGLKTSVDEAEATSEYAADGHIHALHFDIQVGKEAVVHLIASEDNRDIAHHRTNPALGSVVAALNFDVIAADKDSAAIRAIESADVVQLHISDVHGLSAHSQGEVLQCEGIGPVAGLIHGDRSRNRHRR